MKQRIRVVGIVRKKDDILLLKKNMGRAEGEPTWELPTGKIILGEQPEEAMTRTVAEYLGVGVSGVKLKDVTTFMSLSNASRVSNLYIVFDVSLVEGTLTPSERYAAYRWVSLAEVARAGLNLDDATRSVIEIDMGQGSSSARPRAAANGATVFTDGGSRGNPGPAGIGYYIVDANGRELKRGGEFIGFATSRVAEYYGLKEGMEQAIELGLKSVRFVGDNLMMVNQMNGIYQVKNEDIRVIYEDIQKMLPQFEAVAFLHVKREQNKQADEQVNLAIDRHFA